MGKVAFRRIIRAAMKDFAGVKVNNVGLSRQSRVTPNGKWRIHTINVYEKLK